jgi:DNA-binding IclR family transcriptional regulator
MRGYELDLGLSRYGTDHQREGAIQVIDRVGRVLDAFTADKPGLTLTECAAACGLTKSSAHRLLSSLEEVGLVERDGNTWRLGARIVRLATVRLGQVDLRHEASLRLRELGLAHRAAVAYSVPNGSDMVYIERRESPDPYAPSARLGGLAPIWAGAAGRAILSRLPTSERERRLDTPGWHRLPSATRKLVLDQIDESAERGYAVDPGLFFEGVAGLAAAIRDLHGYPVAALSVIVAPERLNPALQQAVGARLVELVAELETVVGLEPNSRVIAPL